VAPKSVGDYLERIRIISKATEPDDRVYANITGKAAKTLYTSLIASLLKKANLREGTQGVALNQLFSAHLRHAPIAGGCGRIFPRRADGTSVHMIESHYGHVNTIKHADRVLQGMTGWERPQLNDAKAKALKAAETHDKSKRG
jgi:integrase